MYLFFTVNFHEENWGEKNQKKSILKMETVETQSADFCHCLQLCVSDVNKTYTMMKMVVNKGCLENCSLYFFIDVIFIGNVFVFVIFFIVIRKLGESTEMLFKS